jgi:putative NADPH-quinone reductase/1,4-dihydroxy-2-naphthoate octaprenyltransferase
MLDTIRRAEPEHAQPNRRQAGPLRVLVINGHPRLGSFSDALADAYASGAVEAGAAVRRLRLADLTFDLNVLQPSPREQETEPAVADAMDQVAWADHLVFVFPTWWGTMPALLKGFLDRVLMPGFAFEDRDDDEGWDQLLLGRSAHLLTTMDTPAFVYRWIYGSPGLNGLGRATLGFCGIAPVRRSIYGPIKTSDAAGRKRWLADARAAGVALRHGVRRPWEQRLHRLGCWMAALRLQYHPMVWGAYGLGAATALVSDGSFAAGPFWLGLLCLVALEAATVFVNELVDWPSDHQNRHFGPFSGGSRVLVDGKLTRQHLRIGSGVALAMAAALAAFWPPGSSPAWLTLGVLAVLAIGYTAPPLKLCWRGLGEIDVAATHSILVLLLGHALQGGRLDDPLPWAVGAPLFFSILPSITLSGVPDYDADRAAGKRTLAVLLGPRGAVRFAQATTALAAAIATALQFAGPFTDAFRGIAFVVIPHATWLVLRLERYLAHQKPPGRIDGLMALSLTYLLWLVVVPLWWLTR